MNKINSNTHFSVLVTEGSFCVNYCVLRLPNKQDRMMVELRLPSGNPELNLKKKTYLRIATYP